MLGSSQNPGGKGVSRWTPFIHPQNFLTYVYIVWSKIDKLSFKKVSAAHPQKMHLWMDTFSSFVLSNVETVLLALRNG
jgi:hypothetical protein